jgi:tetratricopeptide (TPR) repeat protein
VTGRLTAAIDSLEQAIELDPLSPPIIADLGLVHAFGDNFEAAAMYCRRAMELDPHFHRSFWFLGLSHAWSGRFQEAEDALKRGLELCQGRAFRSRLLGALGYAYGRWGKSQAALDVRRELEGMRPAAWHRATDATSLDAVVLRQRVAGDVEVEGLLLFLELGIAQPEARERPEMPRLEGQRLGEALDGRHLGHLAQVSSSPMLACVMIDRR